MNALHYRGDSGARGTSLQCIITEKMKHILRRWIGGPRSKGLRHLHFHIDDPTYVIPHKRVEQKRRDSHRHKGLTEYDMDGLSRDDNVTGIGFQDELNVPWSSLLQNRNYKDELAWLHLFCSALAAFELLQECRHKPGCTVQLHGGSFALPTSFENSVPSRFMPWRQDKSDERGFFRGCVILRFKEKDSTNGIDEDLFVVPRCRSLIFDTNGRCSLGTESIRHGEAETRFVAVFKLFIERPWLAFRDIFTTSRGPTSRHGDIETETWCGSLIISDDTDVLVILLCNKEVHGHNITHALNGSIHFVDEAAYRLKEMVLSGRDIAMAYTLAGCDLTPSVHRIGHEVFLDSLI